MFSLGCNLQKQNKHYITLQSAIHKNRINITRIHNLQSVQKAAGVKIANICTIVEQISNYVQNTNKISNVAT